MALKRKSRAGVAIVAGGVAVAGAAAIHATRSKAISVRGWLVTNVIVPRLYGTRGQSIEKFHQAIADNRAAGPARPSDKIRAAYHFVDETGSFGRVFRLAPKGGPRQTLRILYLHGGGYVFDLMATQWPLIRGFVDRTGGEVVTPLYPLAPENNVEAALGVAQDAYDALVAEVGSENIVVVGDSAGGGLSLALAQRLRDARQPLPAALILFFPWLDVTLSGSDQPALQKLDPLLSLERLREAGIMWAGAGDPKDPAASPLFGDQNGLPPTQVLVGTKDLLLSDSRRLARANADVIVREYRGMFHGWVCAPIPEARRALDEAAEFVAAHVRALASAAA